MTVEIINIEKNKDSVLAFQQTLRYLIGGSTTAILNWLLIYIFVEYANIHYMISMNLAVVVIYLYSFIVNKFFVFRNRTETHVKQGSYFVIMRVVLLVVANLLMFIGVDWLGIPYLITNIMVSVWDATASFLIMKFFIFTNVKTHDD